MDSSPESWTLNAILPRALRIAVGAALFAAVLILLGSAGAFASSGASPASIAASKPAPDKGKGLLSGILSPVVDVVDKTVSQVPVVKDVLGNNTVGKVVAPVSTVTDKVESAVTAVPVVDSVVAPVRQVTNAVVPPVINVVETVASPVVSAVDHATAPVVQVVAPVLSPITGTVQPVVDGVTGGVADVVDTVVVPVLPLVPSTPNLPGTPSTPVVPNVPAAPSNPDTAVTPVTPGDMDGNNTPEGPSGVETPGSFPSGNLGDGDAVEGSRAELNHSASAEAAVKAGVVTSGRQLDAQDGAAVSGALAPYLSGGHALGASTAGESTAQAAAQSGEPTASCASDSQAAAVGPCAPAVASVSVQGPGSGSSAGGSGGPAGPVAASENTYAQFVLTGGAGALAGADWPLPASMPENPGSTPD
ncbi:hypothetical protein [Arthrobacter sp. N199823]|uniref:hypothetical protein n=1 Tax=Arthrobacter sp. N199823 TaxID=2058895 RepID=UPI0011B0EF9A|nr:hypothetical protein [Arthrobacter sp. N199823]